MVDKTEEYYCVINHSLEEFTLDVLHSWEMNDEVNPISYRVNKVIQIPDYVSTLDLNSSTSEILNTKYSIVDKDNLLKNPPNGGIFKVFQRNLYLALF